jgi:hypothetical protein
MMSAELRKGRVDSGCKCTVFGWLAQGFGKFRFPLKAAGFGLHSRKRPRDRSAVGGAAVAMAVPLTAAGGFGSLPPAAGQMRRVDLAG